MDLKYIDTSTHRAGTHLQPQTWEVKAGGSRLRLACTTLALGSQGDQTSEPEREKVRLKVEGELLADVEGDQNGRLRPGTWERSHRQERRKPSCM